MLAARSSRLTVPSRATNTCPENVLAVVLPSPPVRQAAPASWRRSSLLYALSPSILAPPCASQRRLLLLANCLRTLTSLNTRPSPTGLLIGAFTVAYAPYSDAFIWSCIGVNHRARRYVHTHCHCTITHRCIHCSTRPGTEMRSSSSNEER